MRIRLFTAFASNNSGSYTIVGSFRDAATAAEVARVVQEACDTHHAWHEEHQYQAEGESPLDALAKREGLRADKPGREDDWPAAYGSPPTAIASDRQVIVHVPYTVTMPPIFGALFYARGGRVEAELDHTHDDLAVEVGYRARDLPWNDPREAEVLTAFEERVGAELAALTARGEHDNRPAVAPAWHRGFWGARSLSAVFRDLVEGVQALRRVADEVGVLLTLRVYECPHGARDPFAMLRERPIPWGQFRVILWKIGEDRIAAMKAVRDALGCGLADAKAALQDLPREILVDVGEEHAKEAAAAFVRAGCDAEVVLPAQR
jgi:ribosomal protein L7/L12